MRRVDSFSAAVVLTRLELFKPGTHPELAFFGDTDRGRIAVLDGTLQGPRYKAARAGGLVVVRESVTGVSAYVDRVPLTSTLRTESGGRGMWLSNHRGDISEGVFELAAGRAVFNGVDIQPLAPTATLADHGMETAYCNTTLEDMLLAEQVTTPAATSIVPIASSVQ